MDLVNYGLRERYEQLKKRGDMLDDIKKDNRLGEPETSAQRPFYKRH